MKDLVDALAQLQKTLQSGETPSDDLLKRVKKAVDAVANVLAAQAPATGAVSVTTPDGTAAGAVGTSGSSSTTAADTAASDAGGTADTARASLAALDKKLADLAGAVGATHPDVAQKLTDLAATLDRMRNPAGKIILNSDDLFKFLPRYETHPAERIHLGPLLYPVARAFTDRIFRHLLARKFRDNDTVIFTAGGSATGARPAADAFVRGPSRRARRQRTKSCDSSASGVARW